MTSINDKMGLKRAGKRSMMKLPPKLADRNQITGAVCPTCGRRGANASKTKPGKLYCTWCNTIFELLA